MNEDYKVYYVHFPGDVLAAVRVDETGFASIYINDQLSLEAQKKAFIHEMAHIERNDHYNNLSIREIEAD